LIPTAVVATVLFASASARAADVVPTAPAPARAPTFSVVEIGPDTLPRSLTADLEAAAAAGLAAAGAKVVARVPSSPAEAGPSTLLRGTCQVDGSTYHLHLVLEDARTGATVVARDDVCEICTEKDVAETVNIAASALKTAFDHTPRSAPQTVTPARPMTAPASAAVHPRAQGRWRRVLPWLAVGAGAAAMGVGIYYLAIDGKPVYCQMGVCGGWNDSKAWGIEYLAAGAAVAATGLVFVLLPPRATEASRPTSPAPRTVGVTVLPNALAAWGTF
jgi:hypothetical protein